MLSVYPTDSRRELTALCIVGGSGIRPSSRHLWRTEDLQRSPGIRHRHTDAFFPRDGAGDRRRGGAGRRHRCCGLSVTYFVHHWRRDVWTPDLDDGHCGVRRRTILHPYRLGVGHRHIHGRRHSDRLQTRVRRGALHRRHPGITASLREKHFDIRTTLMHQQCGEKGKEAHRQHRSTRSLISGEAL